MERSFLENMPRPLFTQLRGETVWKFGIDPESGLRSGQEGSKKSRSAASWRQRRVLETPSAIFQTVSEGVFCEVRGSKLPHSGGTLAHRGGAALNFALRLSENSG